MKPIRYKDTELLSRLPIGRWFSAGSLSIPSAKLSRLVRLGVLERRQAQDPKLARRWDYMRRS